MSLLDWIRPKWKHRDAVIRERAVLALHNQEVLESIVNDDPSEPVRLAALTRISNQKMLARFACRHDAIALEAMKRLTDRTLLADVALRATSREVREFAVDVLDDRVVLHRIANSDPDSRVRLKARRKHVGRDPTREVIQGELAKLPLSQPTREKASEFCGTLDEICLALVSDSRFCISGSVDTNLPGQATVRELNSNPAAAPATAAGTESTAPVARLLALKRTDSTGTMDETADRTFFEIAVTRTAENTFHCYTEVKRLEMVLNPRLWSSVSNGATGRSSADLDPAQRP
jgi:hypothetical protein